LTAEGRLRAGWLAAGLLYGVLAVWLAAHPVSLPSDDALFFVRGVERFSVLEFRPHFPGYPGFIAVGKLLALTGLDPAQAVFAVSLLSALAIPPLAAWCAASAGGGPGARLAAFCAALTQPFLRLVGLSLMSDGAGVAFLLAALALQMRGQAGGAGLAYGAALACRPSFLVPVVAAVLVGLWQRPGQRGRLLAGCAAPLAVAGGGLLALEGMPLITEGVRFVQGHVLLWGNTALAGQPARPGWGAVLCDMPSVTAALGMWIVAAGARGFQRLPLVAATAAAVLWTLVFQNPENARHLLLPSVLLAVLAASGVTGWRWLPVVAAVGLQAVPLVQTLVPPPRPAPLAQAVAYLDAQPPALVIANRGVARLRAALPAHRVADAYYAGSAAFLAGTFEGGPVFRLTGTEPAPGEGPVIARFPGRVPGERTMWLVRLQSGL